MHDTVDDNTPAKKSNRDAFGDMEARRIEERGREQAEILSNLSSKMLTAARDFEISIEGLAGDIIKAHNAYANILRQEITKYNQTIAEIYDKLDFEK